MNPFEMVAIIILIVTVGSVLRAKYGVGRDKLGNEFNLRGGQIEQENQELRRELRAMQERLAVLERLATDDNDSSARLDREIERLRDKH